MAKKMHQDPLEDKSPALQKTAIKNPGKAAFIANEQHPVLQESLAVYGDILMNKTQAGHFTNPVKDEVSILGSALNKPEGQMTALEKMDIVRTGVSKNNLERLKEKTGLDYDTLAQALSVTRATLINKKNSEKFNAPLSERIVGLADIYSYGYEVFEDTKIFNQWMFRPNQALGGQAPYQLIDNQFGREEVKNIIGRIDYGVYS